MGLPEQHEHALEATGRLVEGVKPDQLDDPTPCDGWNVRELLNHVVSGNFWVGELVAGRTISEVGDKYDGDVIGADPAAAYRDSALVAGPAFKEPGAMEKPVAVSYGPVPGVHRSGHWSVGHGDGSFHGAWLLEGGSRDEGGVAVRTRGILADHVTVVLVPDLVDGAPRHQLPDPEVAGHDVIEQLTHAPTVTRRRVVQLVQLHAVDQPSRRGQCLLVLLRKSHRPIMPRGHGARRLSRP